MKNNELLLVVFDKYDSHKCASDVMHIVSCNGEFKKVVHPEEITSEFLDEHFKKIPKWLGVYHCTFDCEITNIHGLYGPEVAVDKESWTRLVKFNKNSCDITAK